MVLIDVEKLRMIFGSVVTDVELVLSDKVQLEQEAERLRHELIVLRADGNIYQDALMKADRTVRALRKTLKARKR